MRHQGTKARRHEVVGRCGALVFPCSRGCVPSSVPPLRAFLHSCLRSFAFSLLLIVIIVLCPFARGEDAPPAKLPVPHSAEQIKAEHLINERYKVQYAQHDPADQLALASTMRTDISQFADDAPVRYVLLREARELAIDGGDLDAAFAAIDDMDKIFAIDARELKASAMTAMVDKSAVPPPALVAKYLQISDGAVSIGDIDMANKGYALAAMLADQSRDADLKQRVKEEHIAIMQAVRDQKAVAIAINRVKLHPDDAADSLVVGKYACFVRELWPQGLPYLAKGSDPKLKSLAQNELNSPTDADALAAMADAWWDYGNSATGKIAERSHLHAADLYKQAMPNLSEEKKKLAGQRVVEAEAKSAGK
jgi:hypothetical protein